MSLKYQTEVWSVFAFLLVFATLISSWVTHVVACIKASAWILLLFGVFVPPIGWIHGIGVWFGLM